MDIQGHGKIKMVDYATSRFFSHNTVGQKAADESIDNPCRHLLTQQEIYENEGGFMGVASQVGGAFAGMGLLFSTQPQLWTYFSRSQLRSCGWM